MTEQSSPVQVSPARASNIVPSGESVEFTKEATAAYGLAVTIYADKVEAIAVARCTKEIVTEDLVKNAVDDLGGAAESATARLVTDWIKRIAFLFIGFSVVQTLNVMGQATIDRGSVRWLMANIVVASVLIGAALAVDIPAIRKFLRSRKNRKKTSSASTTDVPSQTRSV